MITTNNRSAGTANIVDIDIAIDPAGATAISTQLRDATTDAHHAIERRPLQKDIAAGTVAPLTLAQYLAQLQRIHETIESLLASLRTARPDTAPLLENDMLHSRRLADDLRAIRPADNAVDQPLADTDRTIAHLHAAVSRHDIAVIGAHYVLEGSMNGNAFIVRGLRRSPAIVEQIGLSYFEPYGETQRARWQAFKFTLDVLPLTDDERAAIVAAAQQMFADLMAVGDACGA
jgi:heme oxygenase